MDKENISIELMFSDTSNEKTKVKNESKIKVCTKNAVKFKIIPIGNSKPFVKSNYKKNKTILCQTVRRTV